MRSIRRTSTGFVSSADWMFAMHARKRIEAARKTRRDARELVLRDALRRLLSLGVFLVRPLGLRAWN